MARAFASRVIAAPVEAIWPILRDFGGLSSWLPGLGPSSIEGGRSGDSVGCIRAFALGDGTPVREALLALDDARYTLRYDFQTPAFPVTEYVAELEAIPLSAGDSVSVADATLVRWSASFDEAPADHGTYAPIISQNVFARGLEVLAAKAAASPVAAGPRWQGLRPAKVYCASVIRAPATRVWARVRDFAGMGGWHEDVRNMHMTDGAAGDQVGGVRDFVMDGGRLLERLTWLSDPDMAFRYVIDASPMPWLNYHAGLRLYPVTADDTTVAVWTADWVASAWDDARLIPAIHANVFQKAFDTLDQQLAG